MPKPSLLILAAGLGSRYKGHKQIEAVGPCGACLYDYAVYDAGRAGFEQIVFIVSRQMQEPFMAEIRRKYGRHDRFEYVYQELDSLPPEFSVPKQRIKPWGTAHAVLTARHVLRKPFLAVNADDYYGPTSYQMIAAELGQLAEDSLEQVMVGFELEKTLSAHGGVSRGACEVQNGYLSSIAERKHIRLEEGKIVYRDAQGQTRLFKPGTLVSMNFWGLIPQTIFPILERYFNAFLERNANDPQSEFYLPLAVNQAVLSKEIRVKVLPGKEAWLGMTYVDDREQVRKQIRSKIEAGMYPENLFASRLE